MEPVMKKENNKTPLVDELLRSVEGLREAETGDYFYTRLRARMEARKEEEKEGWSLPFRPAWVIGCLTVLLAVNSVMALQQFNGKKTNTPPSATLETFATSYNQTINTAY